MYYSPTYGKLDLASLKGIISSFMSRDKKGRYEIIVGTDSQKVKTKGHDFVSALIVHHVGHGGIYFWKRQFIEKTISLKERIYQEAIMSLETSENFISFFKLNGISKYDIQIHVDIGHNGETRDLISEVVGMIRGSGYDVKIKPAAYGASKVADRHV
ncbi:ribonuclease H-like YkuK family protein [Candidatus Roizmanbacteria bacterium]|nr:ribonuclease H-like YkuK family protein [Candidatus Roizmanbacteria bacterium]